jgi:hypothetical protein
VGEDLETSGRTYYSVRLDDPTFATPFNAYRVGKDEGGFALIWSGPYRGLQRPLRQTQRRPFQFQRPDTQRGRVQPRGGGGRLSALGGGLGGRLPCAMAVLNGATKIARHAISTALRLRIPAPSWPSE